MKKNTTRKTIAGNKNIQMYLDKSDKKAIKINNLNILKLTELVGVLSVVYFSPDELKLIKDIPEEFRLKIIDKLSLIKTYDEEKNNNCLLIDFGANCTSCIAFEKGKLRDLFVIPFGSQNITKDISTLYSVSEEKSEVLKINLSLTTNETWKNKTEESTISRKQIENVAMGRLMEIIQLIEGRIGNLELNGGIVLTGGGSKLICFADLLQTKLLAEVRNISYDNFTASEFAKPENALILSLLSNGEQNCCEQKEIKTKDKKKEKNLNNVWNKFGNMFND